MNNATETKCNACSFRIVDLFSQDSNETKNLLPFDGEVIHHGVVFNLSASEVHYQRLLSEIEWSHDQAMIFGKLIETKRKVAWYATEPLEYTYSKITKKARLFNDLLIELKENIEAITGESYNSCLLNLYHDGSEGMAYHSDGEPDLKKNGSIASLSFGATRKFSFKHKIKKNRIDVLLESGSLIEMRDVTQEFWLHRLPLSKKVLTPRINLTFRTVIK